MDAVRERFNEMNKNKTKKPIKKDEDSSDDD